MISQERIEEIAHAAAGMADAGADAVYQRVKAELAAHAEEPPAPKQEYPKYVGDQIVNSAEEEAALTGAPSAEVEEWHPEPELAPEPVVEPASPVEESKQVDA